MPRLTQLGPRLGERWCTDFREGALGEDAVNKALATFDARMTAGGREGAEGALT